MTELTRTPRLAGGARERAFLGFKYGVYGLLALNVLLFFLEEDAGFSVAFSGEATVRDVIESFSATIDTAAWMVLLALFELETFVLSAPQLRATRPWLHGVRFVCYAFIVWAFSGYVGYLRFLYDLTPLEAVASTCDLAGARWSFLVDIDEYTLITRENCSTLDAGGVLVRLRESSVVADGAALASVRPLAWADVINSGTWLLVVMLLELDVRLEARGRLRGLLFSASYAAKLVLYVVLLGAAVYWGVRGALLDFWDAFLWLLAFVFIELNVFGSHRQHSHA